MTRSVWPSSLLYKTHFPKDTRFDVSRPKPSYKPDKKPNEWQDIIWKPSLYHGMMHQTEAYKIYQWPSLCVRLYSTFVTSKHFKYPSIIELWPTKILLHFFKQVTLNLVKWPWLGIMTIWVSNTVKQENLVNTYFIGIWLTDEIVQLLYIGIWLTDEIMEYSILCISIWNGVVCINDS